MGLQEYNRKRDFKKTPEPAGKLAREGGRSFVIQKHAASHLHYDFRLEMEGVLKSWSVPKGPSYDTKVKRLAMMTEDHPVDYGTFEGIIPKGEYGGGTVLLWDHGTWTPLGDPHEMLRKGNLKFELHGEKMRGKWALVRIKGKDARDEARSWLLLKERDETVRPESEYSVTEERPESVATGRQMEQIAADKDDVWHSNRTPVEARQRARKAPAKAAPAGAKKGALPKALKPQLATLVDTPPEGEDWVHEMKFDGWRILARLEDGEVTLVSRNGKDWTAQFPSVVRALSGVPVKSALLDGEVAVLLPNGLTSFQALQNVAASRGQLVFFAFDLLYEDGYDLTKVPLLARKERLEELLADRLGGTLRYSDHLAGNGHEFLAQACRMGLEGIISKRGDAPYQAGRARTWLKIKCHLHQEVVLGGYTSPTGSRVALGAIHVGVYDEAGKLRYAGKVGTGFSDKVLRDLHKLLSAQPRTTSPFADKVPGASSSFWVDPTLVGEVEFTEWTDDGRMRHPTWRGLRPDKKAQDVVRESAVPVEDALPSMGASGGGEKRPRRSAETPKLKKGKKTESAASVAGVRITNPERVIYPAVGTTKLDLARFYESIADWVLPHLEGRPTTLVRCPGGLAEPCFYQKHTGWWAPEALRRIKIREKTKVGEYLVVDDVAGLVALAQIGILEIHTWNARAEKLENPDRMVFDLDPHEDVTWTRVAEAALRLRERLRRMGLESFVKTTGGKGLHVVVPLTGKHTWDDTTEFSGNVAAQMTRERPEAFTDNMSKARRVGKIYVDYLRNTRGATAVVPYSTRAKEKAPVSTPITWEELASGVRPEQFTITTVARRLATLRKDPWADYADVKQRLTAAMKKEVAR